jgi:UV DNA damage endonuclease
MIRLGLCCIFREEPIRFRRKTARSLASMNRKQQLEALSEICLSNAVSLRKALEYCDADHIGDFRINSQLFPLYTHPELGYTLEALPQAEDIARVLSGCRTFSASRKLRTTFHPDQFIMLSSPHPRVTDSSLAELRYHAMLAGLIGSDVINLHGGGAYGDKGEALRRLRTNVEALPDGIRNRLTLENDDRVYAPRDLLPVCEATDLPLVYDVHHHRCLTDGMSVEEATERAAATWDREPLFHLSSPLGGWDAVNPRLHADFIDPADFPDEWVRMGPLTVEVEAKAKELAVKKLREDLGC